MILPRLLRAGVLLLLLAAVWWVPAAVPAPAAGQLVRLPGGRWWRGSGAAEWLAGARAPLAVVREAGPPPTAAEFHALAALRAPLYAVLPEHAGALVLTAPERPVAGRAAAVGFRLTGRPGDTAWVRLADAAGPVDSARVRLDSAGTAVGGLRVRPAGAGWRRWSAAAGASRATTGAWVAPPRPLRVLVRGGPPGWESKFTVRALEEAGAEVALAQPLGSGLTLRAGGAAALEYGALEEVDVVLLLAGASPTPGEARLLAGWVAQRGGGVIAVGAAPSPFRAGREAGAAIGTGAGAIRWKLPPELTPLPDTALRVAAIPLGAPLSAARVAAGIPSGPVLLLRPSGAGRIAQLGLTDSWRWRMEAGAVEPHRAFWRGLADWAAAGSGAGPPVLPPAAEVAPGAAAQVRVAGAPDARALRVELPDGSTERLALRADPARVGLLRARFVPLRPGIYRFGVDDAPPSAALEVRASAAAEAPWARLALLAAHSGGSAAPARLLEKEIARVAAVEADQSPRRNAGPWVFGVLLALAGTEWTLRRLRGRP